MMWNLTGEYARAEGRLLWCQAYLSLVRASSRDLGKRIPRSLPGLGAYFLDDCLSKSWGYRRLFSKYNAWRSLTLKQGS